MQKKVFEVNKADNNGVTPLYIAVIEGHSEVVQLLLAKKGIDVNAADNNGVTPLYIAAYKGHVNVIERLVEDGADVNKANINGVTPLYIAAKEGHSEVVQLLLKKEGIEVNKADNKGVTPLFIAAQNGYVNIGAILLIHGANFDIIKNRGDFSDFCANAINHIAQGIIDYDEYPLKGLVFAMGSHQRLGSDSIVSEIKEDIIIRNILDLAAPRKIELNKMQEQHRAAVQQRINELQQEKVAPDSNVAANGVTQISQKLAVQEASFSLSSSGLRQRSASAVGR